MRNILGQKLVFGLSLMLIIGLASLLFILPVKIWQPKVNKFPSAEKINKPQRAHWFIKNNLKETENDFNKKTGDKKLQLNVQDISKEKYTNISKTASNIVAEEYPALNRTTNNINIFYLWTEGPKAKVVSVMTINPKTGKSAIIVIPLFTKVKAENKTLTIGDIYQKKGRAYLKKYLEEKLEIKFKKYVNVDQEALLKLSSILGPLKVNGDTLTMADAFEQTAIGRRHDDQDIVREVVKKSVRPGILLELPNIVWVFTHDIETDLTPGDLLALYKLSKKVNMSAMLKTAMPGEDIFEGGQMYRKVEDRTWKNIIYQVTE